MLSEAAGGWMWFGALNRLRHMAEGFGDLLRGSVFQPNFAGPLSLAHNSLDTRTLCALLTDRRFRFGLLTGHSKGNLVIAEALYALKDAGHHTNMELRWHLPVREVMSALRRERGSALLH